VGDFYVYRVDLAEQHMDKIRIHRQDLAVLTELAGGTYCQQDVLLALTVAIYVPLVENLL
jgi:hypothetical protein